MVSQPGGWVAEVILGCQSYHQNIGTVHYFIVQLNGPHKLPAAPHQTCSGSKITF